MKKILLATALCASLSFAQTSEYKYEITPMLGGAFTEGNMDLDRNYSNFGLSLGFNQEADSLFDQIELGVLRTITDVDYDNNAGDTGITRVFTNFVKDYSLTDSASLYALIGAGVEIFDTEKLGNENGLFGNYGVGIKYKITDDVALKFDLRHLIETDHGDNSLLYTVGVAIPFGEKSTSSVKQTQNTTNSTETKEEETVTAKQTISSNENVNLDTDADGVIDSKDKCPNTTKGTVVDANGCALKVDLEVHFAFDSAKIANEEASKVEEFANFLNKYPTTKAQINAYTDSLGTESYNQKLSLKRADSVKSALVKYGVDANRITTIGHGENNPVASNDTEEGRLENRRVEGTIQQ